MNENIFDVLMYLFENYMIEDIDSHFVRADIEDELIRLGFSNNEVGNAFGWLEGLIDQCNTQLKTDDADLLSLETDKPAASLRYYLPLEKQKISPEIRGLLYTLEQNNMINHEIREIMIDRMMAISSENVLSEDKAKWIMMMVLTNCHAATEKFNQFLDFAESFVFNDDYKH